MSRLMRFKRWTRRLWNGVLVLVFFAMLFAGILVLEGFDPREFSGYVRVVDGDTLVMNGERLRLAGVDAPETAQECRRGSERWLCGRAATRALRQKVLQADVRCISGGFDRYDRWLVECDQDGKSLNKWLVESGWAVNYRGYATEEKEARANQRGIWVSRFERPVDWRRNKRLQSGDLGYGSISTISRLGQRLRSLLAPRTNGT